MVLAFIILLCKSDINIYRIVSRMAGQNSGVMDDVGSDGATVQGEGSQDIGEGERSQSSFSRRTGRGKSTTVLCSLTLD
jgi:hypothetical protein